MSARGPQELRLQPFRQGHPWPAEQRALGRAIEYVWEFELPTGPDEAWRSIGDTERTNRAAGLTALHYEEQGGELVGSHVTAGIRHEFVERWQWVTGSTLELVREYRAGLARVMRNIYRFEPAAAGTRISIYYGWIPRSSVGAVAIRLGMYFYGRRFRGLVERLRARIVDQAQGVAAPRDVVDVLRVSAPPLDDDRRRRIVRLRDQLRARGADARVLDRLVDLAVSGDDLDLDRIRIRRLAREWKVDERLAIRAALHATRAGLLQLTWDVLCPHCRGVRQKLTSLGDVPEEGSCDACGLSFETEGENAVEVTFRIHPSIREVPDVVYCSAQAARRVHVRVQQRLAPGEARELSAPLPPGRYRMRGRGAGPSAHLHVAAGRPVGERIEWTGGAPREVEVGPDPVLVLRAPADREEICVVEEEAWDADALLPVHLFSLQDFRDLFSEETLAAGVKLYVGEQTILFSDIVGSTRLYAEAGDPAAFAEVKRHFALIYAEVASHGGGVVKTIGDAVMAAFSDPVQAVEAARAIHLRFPGPDAGAPSSVRLRISIHTGPCIAVNLNSGIDYFGGTVNTAAKLQRCAGAGEAALSESVQRAPGVLEVLRARGGALRPDALDHDALGRLPVAVWMPAPASAQPPEPPETRAANPATSSASPSITSTARRPDLAGTRNE